MPPRDLNLLKIILRYKECFDRNAFVFTFRIYREVNGVRGESPTEISNDVLQQMFLSKLRAKEGMDCTKGTFIQSKKDGALLQSGKSLLVTSQLDTRLILAFVRIRRIIFSLLVRQLRVGGKKQRCVRGLYLTVNCSLEKRLRQSKS